MSRVWKWLMVPVYSYQETGWPERVGTTRVTRLEVIWTALILLGIVLFLIPYMVTRL